MQRVCHFFLTAMVVYLLFTPGASGAANGDKGRAYFDLGVFAYEDGKYGEAEKYFKTALTFGPGTPVYHHYLGRTYLMMERYAEAGGHLDKAWQADPMLPGLAYDVGLHRFRTGAYADAADRFMAVAGDAPSHILAYYYAGVCLYHLERYKEAIGYFLHASEKSPTVRASARYYAGVCRHKTGDASAALRLFQQVKEDPSAGELGESAARWVAALKEQEERARPYSLYLKMGRRYDDNVVLDPEDTDLFSEESDSSLLIYFSGNYDFFVRGPFRFGAGYSHYQIWYDDLNAYNLTGSLGNVHAEYTLAPVTFRLNYLPSYYWADSDSYLREHGIESEIYWRINRALLTRLAHRYLDNAYFDDPGRTGHSHEMLTDVYWGLLNGKLKVVGGISYEDVTAASVNEYYTLWRIALGLVADLPWDLETGLSLEYNDKAYDNRDSFYGVEREDDKYIGSLYASRKVFYDWLKILAEYRYVRNVSNINDFEYDRNTLTLSVTASY